MMNWIVRIILPVIGLCLMGATHIGPAFDTKPRNALDTFATKLAKEYQLEFLNSGSGPLADSKQGIWALNLVSRQPVTLEQGRLLATAIAHKLLDKVFKDPLFAQYCQKVQTSFRGPELKKEYVAFRLAFWDENTNRPQSPFLAQIRFADGNLYYYFADPVTQALNPPIIEVLDL